MQDSEYPCRFSCWERLDRVHGYSLPSEIVVKQAVRSGWTSDGVTAYPDKLCGVSLGTKGEETNWPLKPATLHDFMFWRGGSKEDYHEANRCFRDYTRSYVESLYDRHAWTHRGMRFRVWLRYLGVRTLLARGHFHWKGS